MHHYNNSFQIYNIFSNLNYIHCFGVLGLKPPKPRSNEYNLNLKIYYKFGELRIIKLIKILIKTVSDLNLKIELNLN